MIHLEEDMKIEVFELPKLVLTDIVAIGCLGEHLITRLDRSLVMSIAWIRPSLEHSSWYSTTSPFVEAMIFIRLDARLIYKYILTAIIRYDKPKLSLMLNYFMVSGLVF